MNDLALDQLSAVFTGFGFKFRRHVGNLLASQLLQGPAESFRKSRVQVGDQTVDGIDKNGVRRKVKQGAKPPFGF